MARPFFRMTLAMMLALAVSPATSTVAGGNTPTPNPTTVIIRGETLPVWPVEDLRRRGWEIPDVPREQNAAWVYIDAINAYEEPPKELVDAFDYAVHTDWPAGEVELSDYLQLPANRQAMRELQRASTMGECRMPYFGDPDDSVIALLLPNLSGFRVLGKIMVADGRRLAAQGKLAEAADAYLAAMRTGEHVSQGITLIEGLVGIAVFALADHALVDLVMRKPLPKKQLKRIQTELTRRAARLPSVKIGLRGERRFGMAMVDEICSRPLQISHTVINLFGTHDGEFMTAIRPNANDGWGRLEARIGRVILPDRAVKEHMTAYYDQVVARAEIGAHNAAGMEFDFERYVADVIPKWDVIARGLLPSLSRATLLGERLRAEFAMTRAVVGLRLYMEVHDGATPASLDVIAKALPDEAMIDPFSGEQLRYTRDSDGWTVYSFGPDLVDDGGIGPNLVDDRRNPQRWEDLDMVYGFPPTPVKPFNDDE